MRIAEVTVVVLFFQYAGGEMAVLIVKITSFTGIGHHCCSIADGVVIIVGLLIQFEATGDGLQAVEDIVFQID